MKPLRPQKYIYKLNSTYLDMNNYNVTLNLSDVVYNSAIVISVGHSQLIKWIEELTGTSDNYLKAECVRKEIKYIKSLDNTKENKQKIKNKYDELYNLQFEPNLVSIQFDKKSHFNKCCEVDDNQTPKLKINGKYFHRLSSLNPVVSFKTVGNQTMQPVFNRNN